METIDKNKLLEIIEERMQELHPTNTGKMQTGERIDNNTLMWLNALTWVKKKINELANKTSTDEKPSDKTEAQTVDYFGKWFFYKGDVIKISGAVEGKFVGVNPSGQIKSYSTSELKKYREWTIYDAKTGDILFNKRDNKIFLFDEFGNDTRNEVVHATLSYEINGPVTVHDSFPKWLQFCPATKNQQDEFWNALDTDKEVECPDKKQS